MAAEFGGWQARVLRWLAQHYDEPTNSFAEEASSGTIDEVCSSPSSSQDSVCQHYYPLLHRVANAPLSKKLKHHASDGLNTEPGVLR